VRRARLAAAVALPTAASCPPRNSSVGAVIIRSAASGILTGQPTRPPALPRDLHPGTHLPVHSISVPEAAPDHLVSLGIGRRSARDIIGPRSLRVVRQEGRPMGPSSTSLRTLSGVLIARCIATQPPGHDQTRGPLARADPDGSISRTWPQMPPALPQRVRAVDAPAHVRQRRPFSRSTSRSSSALAMGGGCSGPWALPADPDRP
jgi:hypothetical protein